MRVIKIWKTIEDALDFLNSVEDFALIEEIVAYRWSQVCEALLSNSHHTKPQRVQGINIIYGGSATPDT